jgi:hypothetical protein
VPAKKPPTWKKSRGKLGAFEPLIGSWKAKTDSPMGPLECRRTFSRILGDTCVQLEAEWRMPGNKFYRELAIYAAGEKGTIVFFSFTSDGKRSQGTLTDGSDVHPEAIAFEARMPAGTARMVYWPGDAGAVNWAVEAKNKKGWKRFTHHRYTPA